MQVSIIIINYNTPELTKDCLNSIKKFEVKFDFDFEIILVDNAPRQDNSSNFYSVFPNLNYIKTEENIGFGKANNLGMVAAKGDFFLLLNSDTLLIDDSINNCIHFLRSDTDQKIGLIGCKLLNDDLSYQHSFYPFEGKSLFQYFKSNNPILSKLLGTSKYFVETNEVQTVGDVSGAFMLLRAEVFLTVKGFDPDFFLYCEETEWCRNRIAPVFDIVYFPETRIIHLGGKSAPKKMMAIQSAISEYLFWYKCGWLYYLGYFFVNTTNIWSHILIYPLVKKSNRINLAELLKKYFVALSYALAEIPKYSNKFQARPKGLYYKAAEPIFFSNDKRS